MIDFVKRREQLSWYYHIFITHENSKYELDDHIAEDILEEYSKLLSIINTKVLHDHPEKPWVDIHKIVSMTEFSIMSVLSLRPFDKTLIGRNAAIQLEDVLDLNAKFAFFCGLNMLHEKMGRAPSKLKFLVEGHDFKREHIQFLINIGAQEDRALNSDALFSNAATWFWAEKACCK